MLLLFEYALRETGHRRVQDTTATHITRIFKDFTQTVVKRRTQGGRSLRSGVFQTIRSNVDQTQLIQISLRLQERFYVLEQARVVASVQTVLTNKLRKS